MISSACWSVWASGWPGRPARWSRVAALAIREGRSVAAVRLAGPGAGRADPVEDPGQRVDQLDPVGGQGGIDPGEDRLGGGGLQLGPLGEGGVGGRGIPLGDQQSAEGLPEIGPLVGLQVVDALDQLAAGLATAPQSDQDSGGGQSHHDVVAGAIGGQTVAEQLEGLGRSAGEGQGAGAGRPEPGVGRRRIQSGLEGGVGLLGAAFEGLAVGHQQGGLDRLDPLGHGAEGRIEDVPGASGGGAAALQVELDAGQGHQQGRVGGRAIGDGPLEEPGGLLGAAVGLQEGGLGDDRGGGLRIGLGGQAEDGGGLVAVTDGLVTPPQGDDDLVAHRLVHAGGVAKRFQAYGGAERIAAMLLAEGFQQGQARIDPSQRLVDDTAVAFDQGGGFLEPAEPQQDVGEPPGQVGVGPLDLNQALAPVGHGVPFVPFGVLDQAAEQKQLQVANPGGAQGGQVLAGLGRVAAVQGVLGGGHQDGRVVGGASQGGVDVGLGGGLVAGLAVVAVAGQQGADSVRVPGDQLVEHGPGLVGLAGAVAEQLGQAEGHVHGVGGRLLVVGVVVELAIVEGQGPSVGGQGLIQLVRAAGAGQALQGSAEQGVGGGVVAATLDEPAGDDGRRSVALIKDPLLILAEQGGPGAIGVAEQDRQLGAPALQGVALVRIDPGVVADQQPLVERQGQVDLIDVVGGGGAPRRASGPATGASARRRGWPPGTGRGGAGPGRRGRRRPGRGSGRRPCRGSGRAGSGSGWSAGPPGPGPPGAGSRRLAGSGDGSSWLEAEARRRLGSVTGKQWPARRVHKARRMDHVHSHDTPAAGRRVNVGHKVRPRCPKATPPDQPFRKSRGLNLTVSIGGG